MPSVNASQTDRAGGYLSTFDSESMSLPSSDAGKMLYEFMKADVLRYTIYIDLLFMSGFIHLDSVEQVRDYLLKHEDMIEPVLSICKQAATEFGREAELLLRYDVDPEIQFDSLLLIVRLPEYDIDFFDRINKVLQSNQKLLALKSGVLTLTTDFNSPA